MGWRTGLCEGSKSGFVLFAALMPALRVCSPLKARAQNEVSGFFWRTTAMLLKIISGGQTGVDRAALDAGLASGITVGGWCPAGRRAEDGRIPEHYPLVELDSSEYSSRTEKNVVDSDATLVLNLGVLADGTAFTVQLARKYRKPLRIVQLDGDADPCAVAEWLSEFRVKVLNIAGPRESKRPGVYECALLFVQRLLQEP
jgi:hypothetical protein